MHINIGFKSKVKRFGLNAIINKIDNEGESWKRFA